jgi:hypothetical protein
MDTIRANGHLLPQEKTTRIDTLAQEVSERLTVLASRHLWRNNAKLWIISPILPGSLSAEGLTVPPS